MTKYRLLLNQGLYERMCQCFGFVEVRHRNQTRIEKYYLAGPGDLRKRIMRCGEQYVVVPCPICMVPDRPLSVSHRYGTIDETGYPRIHLAFCPCLADRENREQLKRLLMAEDNRQDAAQQHVDQDSAPACPI